MNLFNYENAFSRNIGWITLAEQSELRNKRVAIGGLGGVGGSHLIALTRMGVGKFNISDLDVFEIANFNRQYGAYMSTIGTPKAEVAERTVKDINPEIVINNFKEGINKNNLDDFLRDVDIYVDSLDIFALEIRRAVFSRCYELGIPAITAAPIGMGSAMLVFMPGKMSFEEYFDLDGYTFEEQVLRFVIGVSPCTIHQKYLVDRSTVNFLKKKAPSTPMGIEISAGVACSNVIKILLNRGDVVYAPHGLHYDAYCNKLVKTWRPWGNKNPLQAIVFKRLRYMLGA
jgi:molybdopterin/thiamine biosynthesis adenylyltransferase